MHRTRISIIRLYKYCRLPIPIMVIAFEGGLSERRPIKGTSIKPLSAASPPTDLSCEKVVRCTTSVFEKRTLQTDSDSIGLNQQSPRTASYNPLSSRKSMQIKEANASDFVQIHYSFISYLPGRQS